MTSYSILTYHDRESATSFYSIKNHENNPNTKNPDIKRYTQIP